ncbi:MAG: hypothetical protein ACI86M_001563 [Saprospiraceae bacterium]|jgi:hypothetical protein
MITKLKISIMSKHLTIFIVLMFGMSSTVAAQFSVYGVVKTPKNKKYHGEVITYEPQESVTMNCQGDTLTFDLNENEFKFTTRKPPKPYNFPEGVGYHRISLGSLSGRPNDGSFISYTYHHQKTRLIGYGGGVSFENYGDTNGYDFIVPRLSIMSFFKEKNGTPFLKADAGYGIALKNTNKDQTKAQGGINAGIALGYRLSTSRVMIDFTVGARMQKGSYEFDFDDFIKIENNYFRRLEIGIGFMW